VFVAVKGIERGLQTTTQLNEIYDPEHAKAANGSQAEECDFVFVPFSI
jgi:hypothetical protein